MPSGSGMRRPIGAWPWLAPASTSVPRFATTTLLHAEWRHCPRCRGRVVLHGEGRAAEPIRPLAYEQERRRRK
jgi:hypothetical protein